MKPSLDFDSCFAVTEAHLEAALAPAQSMNDLSPRERVWALVDRMVAVAAPRQGAPKILLVLARMAASDWIDGVLEVHVAPQGDGTIIEVLLDDGLSVTRLRQPLQVPAPYDELVSAVDLHVDLVAPLEPTVYDEQGFVLRAVLGTGRSSTAPIDAIAPDVLAVPARPGPSPSSTTQSLRAVARPRPESTPTERPAAPTPKSVKPGAKSVRPGAKSVRPGAKSVRPGAKSVRPPAKSVRPAAKSVKPAPPIVPRPIAAAPRVQEAPRRPAPSDVRATVRRAVEPTAGKDPVIGSRPRAPARPAPGDIKATVKVDAVHIPREARREPPKPPPPTVLSGGAKKEGTPLRRDDEE